MPDGRHIQRTITEAVRASDRVPFHTRSYYSTHFLAAAQDAADRAEDVEARLIAADETRFSLELRGHVLSAVILSVAFIEATINEALQDAHDDHHTEKISSVDATTIRAWSGLWSALDTGSSGSALRYYEAAYRAAGLGEPPKGHEPWQSAAILVKLRNHLIHYRPESTSPDDPLKLESQLKDHLSKSPTTETEGGVGKYLSAECARWAVRSTTGFVEWFSDQTSVIPNYRLALDRLRDDNA